MVILHATTTTKVKNRPHQKPITHPHTTPSASLKNDKLLGGGEGDIHRPLPHGECKKILVEETLFFDQIKMDECAKKRNKQI